MVGKRRSKVGSDFTCSVSHAGLLRCADLTPENTGSVDVSRSRRGRRPRVSGHGEREARAKLQQCPSYLSLHSHAWLPLLQAKAALFPLTSPPTTRFLNFLVSFSL